MIEPVDRAQKSGDEGGRGAQIDLLGRAELFDPALVHHRDLVRHRERFFLIVGDEQEGDARFALHRFQFGAHLLAQFGIERGEGLVEQKDLRLEHQRPRQRHPLPLAAGELRRHAISFVRKLTSSSARTARFSRSRYAPLAQPEFHIAQGGQVGKQRVTLKDRADVALIRLQFVDDRAVQHALRPHVGCSKPPIMRRVVVLPHPDGPRSE